MACIPTHLGGDTFFFSGAEVSLLVFLRESLKKMVHGKNASTFNHQVEGGVVDYSEHVCEADRRVLPRRRALARLRRLPRVSIVGPIIGRVLRSLLNFNKSYRRRYRLS